MADEGSLSCKPQASNDKDTVSALTEKSLAALSLDSAAYDEVQCDRFLTPGTTVIDIENVLIIRDFIFSISSSPLTIAVDAEGEDLSRAGELTLISVAVKVTTGVHVFLFDILYHFFQPKIFEVLKNILENEKIEKIIHDCRQDADALAVIGIRLKTVFDTSVFNCHLTNTPLEKRENLNTVLQKFQCQFKGRFRDYDSNPSFWTSRPLSQKQIESASDDVVNLFDLKEKMVETLSRKKLTEKEMHLIYSSSNRAVDEYRSLAYSEIVPVPPNMKGAVVGQSGTTIVSIQRKTNCVISAYIGRSQGYLILADNMVSW